MKTSGRINLRIDESVKEKEKGANHIGETKAVEPSPTHTVTVKMPSLAVLSIGERQKLMAPQVLAAQKAPLLLHRCSARKSYLCHADRRRRLKQLAACGFQNDVGAKWDRTLSQAKRSFGGLERILPDHRRSGPVRIAHKAEVHEPRWDTCEFSHKIQVRQRFAD